MIHGPYNIKLIPWPFERMDKEINLHTSGRSPKLCNWIDDWKGLIDEVLEWFWILSKISSKGVNFHLPAALSASIKSLLPGQALIFLVSQYNFAKVCRAQYLSSPVISAKFSALCVLSTLTAFPWDLKLFQPSLFVKWSNYILPVPEMSSFVSNRTFF